MKGKKLLALFLAVSVLMTNGSPAFAAEAKVEHQEAASSGSAEQSEWEYITYWDGAWITKYLGSDTNVTIPSTIDGLTVTALGRNLFMDNLTVESVYIPETVMRMEDCCTVFTDASNLKEIRVNENNPIYFDRDGVFFMHREGKPEGEPLLVKYPEGKADLNAYVVPNDVYGIGTHAFRNCPALDKIVIPESVKVCSDEAFRLLDHVSIILKQTDTSQIDLNNRAFTDLSDCTIIVKNEGMKQWAIKQPSGEEPLYLPERTTVKLESELTQEERNAYLTPATDLTFADGSKSKKIALEPDEYTNEYTFPKDNEMGRGYYWQNVDYKIGPADTTDVVTWRSSDNQVAWVKTVNGRSVVLGHSHGKCTITGTTESGKTITLDVLVSIPIQDIKCEFRRTDYDEFVNSGTATLDYNSVKNSGKFNGESRIYVDIWSTAPEGSSKHTPSCNDLMDVAITGDTDKLVYGSEHRKACVDQEQDLWEEWDEYYFRVDGPGTVTINVTVTDDDGTIKTGIFTLKVLESASDGGSNTDNSVSQPEVPAPQAPAQNITSLTVQDSNTDSNTDSDTNTKSPSKPAKMKAPTVKAGKKKVALAWKKIGNADSYQIQYSTNSKFKKAKSLNCSGKTAKATIKKLKSGKKYYVRIRAYKKLDGKKYYGSWSKVKSVKVK